MRNVLSQLCTIFIQQKRKEALGFRLYIQNTRIVFFPSVVPDYAQQCNGNGASVPTQRNGTRHYFVLRKFRSRSDVVWYTKEIEIQYVLEVSFTGV